MKANLGRKGGRHQPHNSHAGGDAEERRRRQHRQAKGLGNRTDASECKAAGLGSSCDFGEAKVEVETLESV
jgi:hypothetical protein